jgi:hypothetical protein
MEEEVFTIVSSNKEEFRVPIKAALRSEMIASLINATQATNLRLDGDRAEGVPEITSATLKHVIEFCKYHVENPPKEGTPKRTLKPDDMDDWDKAFVSEEKLEQKALFDLILASNYLNVRDLLDVTCKGLANRLKGKSPQEIVKYFKAVYPFDKEYTPEEEALVRREHPWIENPKAKPTSGGK